VAALSVRAGEITREQAGADAAISLCDLEAVAWCWCC